MGRPERLRCAVVGLGRIGSTLEDDRLREKPASHAGAIAASRECILAAGCDVRADRREAFARRWRCPRVYAELSELIERELPDILHLATPAETHAELAELAASFRVPLIVCEKPLSYSAEPARRLVEGCARSGTLLMVNHERRYSRDYRRVRQLISEGRFGALLSIQARLYMGRGHPPREILWEDGTHLLDVLRYLTAAEIVPRHVQGDPDGCEASLQVLLQLGSVPCHLEVSGQYEALVFELELQFHRGRVRVGNGTYEEWGSTPSPYYERFHSLRRLRTPRPRRTGYFAEMLADAVRVLRTSRGGSGCTPVSSGVDGLRAVEAIEAILALAARV